MSPWSLLMRSTGRHVEQLFSLFFCLLPYFLSLTLLHALCKEILDGFCPFACTVCTLYHCKYHCKHHCKQWYSVSLFTNKQWYFVSLCLFLNRYLAEDKLPGLTVFRHGYPRTHMDYSSNVDYLWVCFCKSEQYSRRQNHLHKRLFAAARTLISSHLHYGYFSRWNNPQKFIQRTQSKKGN